MWVWVCKGVQWCEWAGMGRCARVCARQNSRAAGVGVHMCACVYCHCVEGGVARVSPSDMKNKKKKGYTAFEGGRRGCARVCDGMRGQACVCVHACIVVVLREGWRGCHC